METINTKSWAEFVQAIQDIRDKYGTYQIEGSDKTINIDMYYRGQADESWSLDTTLERKTDKPYTVLSYAALASMNSSEIESFTGDSWNIPDYPDLEKVIRTDTDPSYPMLRLPIYDYLVYLRHHGFPSPLLDWSESPYIASYFACIDAKDDISPAVYCYIETPNLSKGQEFGKPVIALQGKYVKTHKRHFSQKAWYTVAAVWDKSDEVYRFCHHENVFKEENPRQDLLYKIVLPKNIRQEALMVLNDYNINHFTLFHSEDSLIKSIETKMFDLRED
jgi:hypothetical protein